MRSSREPVAGLEQVASRTATVARRYAVTAALAVCIAATLVAGPLASASEADGGTTPAQEAFRASVGTYLENLQSALTAASDNPLTSASIAPHLDADLKALAAANAQLPLLTGDDLDAMQGIVGQDPSWEQQPAVLQQALSEESAPLTRSPVAGATPSTPSGTLSSCPSSTTDLDPRALFYSSWAAAQVASAAGALASGFPDGVVFTPGLIIVGVAYGIANGLYIGLNDALSLNLDCSNAESNALLESAYAHDPSGATTAASLTPASSQASVDRLTTAAAGIDTTLALIEGIVNATTVKLAALINALGLAQGTANTIQAISIDLQARTDDLLSSVGTASDHATYSGAEPSGTANGLANTINARADTTLANTAAFQTLSVRLEIEGVLAANPKPLVAIFVLPASQGGYLETVRDIVTSTIANELAAGQDIDTAQTDLANGNQFLAAGKYEDAFKEYAEAYRQAVK